jgi:hypothetical protein
VYVDEKFGSGSYSSWLSTSTVLERVHWPSSRLAVAAAAKRVLLLPFIPKKCETKGRFCAIQNKSFGGGDEKWQNVGSQLLNEFTLLLLP